MLLDRFGDLNSTAATSAASLPLSEIFEGIQEAIQDTRQEILDLEQEKRLVGSEFFVQQDELVRQEAIFTALDRCV